MQKFILLVIAGFLLGSTACRTARNAPSKNESSAQKQLRGKIADSARKYLGTEYFYTGKSPQTGFDCSGFTSYVMGKNGIKISPASAAQAKEGRSIRMEQVQTGDLIFFGETKDKVSHVALVQKRTPDGIICIHSTTSRGVIEENITTSKYWKPKILFARDVVSKK